jgi:porin
MFPDPRSPNRILNKYPVLSFRLLLIGCAASLLSSMVSALEGESAESLPVEYKSGYGDLPQFGGPSSVAAVLKDADKVKDPLFRFDDIQRALAPWFDWKKRAFEISGVGVGVEVNWLYQHASASLGEKKFAGALYRLNGEWLALGRGKSTSGSLVYRLEYRDRHFTELPPASLGKEIGAASLTPGFAYVADFGPTIKELHWKQVFNNKRAGLVAGILDFSPFFDYYPFTSLGKGFLAREFLLNPTLATTGVGHLGVATRAFIGDHFWVGGAFYDANAVNGELNLDTWNSSELLKHAEIGWTPSFERMRIDRLQLTWWDVDERAEAGVPAGSGWALSVSGEFGNFLPFFRAGHSNGGGGAPAESHVAIGSDMTLRYDDRLSVGLAWNKPSIKTFGEELNDEYLLEISYQLQISQNVSLLPDVQLIINPANNPDEERIWVLGFRVRMTL